MNTRSKILDRASCLAFVKQARSKGIKVGFTNGCFDILHVGHVRYLFQAREMADLLVVAINSDASVRANKGPDRPVFPENERAELLAGLECVDAVVIFGEPSVLDLVKQVKPDVLVKGSDWPEDGVVGREFVESIGGKVVRMPLTEGASTTTIINRIKKLSARS